MGSRWKFPWNDAAIERLRVLWFKGYSASECGAFLGCSRNACMGKIRRLGWHYKLRQQRPAASKAMRLAGPTLPPLEPEPPPPKPKRVRRRREEPQIPPMQTDKRTVPALPFTLSLLELGPRHCKWPCDGDVLPYTFCGAPRMDDGPYCPEHHVRAHQKGGQRDVDFMAAKTMGKKYYFGRAGVEA